jgi:hypothetical protein
MTEPAITRGVALLAVWIVFFPEPTARADEPSSKQEIIQALDDLRNRYGLDAVRMQTHLLQSAIEGGSVLEASAGIGGHEEHEGKRYLRFDVATGIVYDDRSVKEMERPARIWTDVIEPALRHFKTLEIPADGIALHVQFQHTAYRDRTELLRKHAEHPAPSEQMHVRLGSGEIVELANGRLTANDLLDHSTVLLNGNPLRIDLTGIVPAERPPTPAVPLFPPEKP